MLARNVFFGVVVIGALYLSYQYLPFQKDGQETKFSEQPQVVSEREFVKTVVALQDQIDMLQQEVLSLRSQLSTDNSELSSEEATAVPDLTPTEPVVVMAQPKQKQQTSEIDKRLQQQSQLRAIAEKHEVAALNALVK